MNTTKKWLGRQSWGLFSVLVFLILGFSTFARAQTCVDLFHIKSRIIASQNNSSSSLLFLEAQVQKVISEFARTDSVNYKVPRDLTLRIRAKRDSLTQVIYDLDVVARGETPRLMSDKLIMAKVMQRVLREKYANYHPPVLGLKEFLILKNLIDSRGNVVASRKRIDDALREEFPQGFIIKPTVGWSSSGKTFYKDRERVLTLLRQANNELYKPEEIFSDFISDLYRVPTSGEKYMIMGLIKGTSATSKNAQFGEANEFRVHSFYNKVVPEATQTRWYTAVDPVKLKKIEDYIQEFLNSMPPGFAKQSAYSFDVFMTVTGQMQIIEVNTNRGDANNWSGFLRVPHVIGAYARLLKQDYNWQILGVEGWMFYNNLAHVIPHIKYDFPEWIKDAEVLGKKDEALQGLRDLETEFIARARAYRNQPGFLQNSDFLQLIEFGDVFSNKLKAINEVGDSGWVEFVEWTRSLK